ncbi:MAG TPA: hypothetical protein VHA52_11055 [Candidatus Babeliaceae bacterium]|nr:hypothetical protein [Candidatus Babeliaceae bacterium]
MFRKIIGSPAAWGRFMYFTGTTLGSGLGAGMFAHRRIRASDERIKQLEQEVRFFRESAAEEKKEHIHSFDRTPFLTIPN